MDAIDTQQALRGAIESRRCVEVVFAKAPDASPPLSDPTALLESIAGGAGVRVYTRTPGTAAQEIATWATSRGLRIESISTRGPSLEDVFLFLTGPASARSSRRGSGRRGLTSGS